MPASLDIETYFDRDVTLVARQLLGATLLVDGIGGIIVETEAYHPTEPASHAFRGETPRNAAMFLGPGHVYVYRSYGIHWCLNFVCSDGAAILIRALEPTKGMVEMSERRGLSAATDLCSGPGKLCTALAVTKAHDRLRLDHPPFEFFPPTGSVDIVTGPRIGITRAADLPWRFGIAGSPYLSRRFAVDAMSRRVPSAANFD